MPRNKRPTAYFLFREGPFRPLYIRGGGLPPAFLLPPSPAERSALHPRHRPILWEFTSRSVARALCAANHSPSNPCSYAETKELKLRLSRRAQAAPKPLSRKPVERNSLDSLI